MGKSLKKYSNISEQIKDCKYPDITIEIEDYPRYNPFNIHIYLLVIISSFDFKAVRHQNL